MWDPVRARVRATFERARGVLVPLALFGATALLLAFVGQKEPLATWMLWPYAGIWLATALWIACCTSVGHAALRLLPDLRLPFRERLLFDFATGVLVFAVGVFALGVLRLLRPPFFVVYPLLLGATGAKPLTLYLLRARRHFRAVRRRAWRRSPAPSWAYAFGTLGLAVVYLTIMLPENAAFDSLTYHLPIAEHFAAWGRVGPFVEGWVAGVIPHLASWLYTWPFTLRSVNLFGHVELCAHMEFALFVATVFAIPLLVEAVYRRRRVRGTWALIFLFPGLFLYDSSLSLAADHVLAFWAVPIALSVRRVLRRPDERAPGVLAGLMVAGAALTKYQSISLVLPAVALVAVASGRALWRTRHAPALAPVSRRQHLRGLGALVLAALVATAPHWLANLVWYGDPMYPMLAAWLPAHPMVKGWAGATAAFTGGMTAWTPSGTLLQKLGESAVGIFTFAFIPHDWPNFHRDLPVFGFLFTLTLPVLALARGAGRARLLAAGTLLGLFAWYWTFHQDRYLQALLPWMVAASAAALLHAWDGGLVARLGVVALVSAQLVWGHDVPWLPTHAMLRDVPAIRSLQRLSSTYRGDLHARFQYDTSFQAADRALPRDATVLVHEEYLKLGLNRRSLADSARLQPAIDYSQLARPDRVHDLLSSLGVTHLLWSHGDSIDREVPVSGELVFFGYALRYAEGRQELGPFAVARLAARRPPPREPGPVALVGCGVVQDMPLSDVDHVIAGRPPRGVNVDPAAAIAGAEFVVVEKACHAKAPPAAMSPFEQASGWDGWTLWVRRL
ncbi:MAG TPA: hypothetical protein VHL80_03935 [Polyangia bacterium]|nr:hypothetical protein [Polyangia bacterium]